MDSKSQIIIFMMNQKRCPQNKIKLMATSKYSSMKFRKPIFVGLQNCILQWITLINCQNILNVKKPCQIQNWILGNLQEGTDNDDMTWIVKQNQLNKKIYKKMKSNQSQLINLDVGHQILILMGQLWYQLNRINQSMELSKWNNQITNKIVLNINQKQNSLVAGDNTIRCWKQSDSIYWISSQPYKEPKLFVRFSLNQNEDLQFSGSDDNLIRLWKVYFDKKILTYNYLLDKHNNEVMALSLNQSESLLVSCADGKNQIIIWERREQDKYEFKQFVIMDEFITQKKIYH
ncbi:unnamed protein product [Paramecium pentaurelia]|uniref:Uncharacterized protein n=1 Tax=Paramecium pentaurelia TaxID=43138 RepID=A0A8S1VXH1_9CILI|nr:unnamed protein product [Paramecium pentaurelia]